MGRAAPCRPSRAGIHPMSAHAVDLAVEDGRWETAIRGLEDLVTRAVEAGLAVAPERPEGSVEVSILLTDDATVRTLNRTWRGKDKATNVLSFPAVPQPAHAGVATPIGDVVLAYETLVRESAEQSKPLQNHLAHLLVHGTLHCLGQDHETGEAEADAMEALEVAALATLGMPDPYA
jgi:probable rRNA maturation factor